MKTRRQIRSVAWMWLAPLLLVCVVMLVQGLPVILDAADAMQASNDMLPTAPRPYTPLELRGRDIYLREGCGSCHTQMVRRTATDVLRFGAYSQSPAYRFDHPSQWGTRRRGPDLGQIGGKYSDAWHVRHLSNPQAIVAASTMPAFGWLMSKELTYADLPARMQALRRLGVPYAATSRELGKLVLRYGERQAHFYDINRAEQMLVAQAQQQDGDGLASRLTEMDALIAYLQILGRSSAEPASSSVAVQSAARLQ